MSYILLLIILALVIISLIYTNKNVNTESYTNTLDNSLNKSTHPYIDWDNLPTNSVVFSSLKEANDYIIDNKLDVKKVIAEPIEKKYSLRSADINYERKCNKKIALNNYLVDSYNFAISNEDKSDINLNSDYLKQFVNKSNTTKNNNTYKQAKFKPLDLTKYNKELQKFIGDDISISGKSNEEIKQIINKYIIDNSNNGMLNYHLRDCIVDEIANDLSLGSYKDLNQSVFMIDDEISNSEDLEKVLEAKLNTDSTNIKYPLLKQEFEMNNSPITDLMMDKLFGV